MTDDIDERLASRFEGGDEETDAEGGAREAGDATSVQDAGTMSSQNAQKSRRAQNVKKEWNVRSFYLDDDLDDELTTAFKRLDLELSEQAVDLSLKKTRHFYPLIVELGLERLERMESTELTERLERTE